MGDTKKYGLIISKKKSSVGVLKKSSVFGNESSDEEAETTGDISHVTKVNALRRAAKEKIQEVSGGRGKPLRKGEVSQTKDSSKAVNVSLLREADKKKQMKQTQIEVQKALAEDPTVYEYDSVYDQMQEKKKPQVVQIAEKDRKPKYIKGLLKSAAHRKLEYERQIERKAQREREAEGEEFADKDAFVTTAYKKKMQEWAEEEERLKRQDLIDAANDVTKQKDLSQFYRNLLSKNVSVGGTYEADAEESSLPKQDSMEAAKESSKRKDEGSQTNRGDDDVTRNSRERRKSHESSRSERHKDSKRKHRPSDHGSHRAHSSGSDNYSRDERIRDGRREREDSRKEVDYHREELHSTAEKKHSREEVNRVTDEGDFEKDQKKHSNIETNKTEETHSKGKVNEQKSEEVTSKFTKRSTDDSVMSARERYLARKAARENSKAGRKRTDSDED